MNTAGQWRLWIEAGLCVAVCFLAPAVGGLLVGSGPGEWYQSLRKPAFTPPDWLFGPAWTLLYLMMGVALWLVWRQRATQPIAVPLAAFAVQLVLNAAWTPLFFGLHRPGLALMDIAAMWGAIAVTVWQFSLVSGTAAWMLIPYLVWVSFAAILNGSLWWLNR